MIQSLQSRLKLETGAYSRTPPTMNGGGLVMGAWQPPHNTKSSQPSSVEHRWTEPTSFANAAPARCVRVSKSSVVVCERSASSTAAQPSRKRPPSGVAVVLRRSSASAPLMT